VNGRDYFISGVSLMLVKYVVDATIIFAATGQIWTPWGYMSPLLTTRSPTGGASLGWVMVLLVPWSVPFLWIGASMSIRRAADAGLSPWTGLLFFAPVLNYVMMIVLSVLPSAPRRVAVERGDFSLGGQFAAFVLSAVAGAAAGVAMTGLSVYLFASYGAALFLGVPFCMGLVTAFLYNHGYDRTELGTLAAVQLSVLLAGAGLLLFAWEGIVCIAMAYPLAATIAVLGGVVGITMARGGGARAAHAALILLSLPALMGAESLQHATPLREVISTIEIDAPPAAVWPNVIGFSTLPPPSALVFRLGIAYPMRAHIEGTGVGAVRHCEFSTGPFVEPITRWEPPSRLSFDVASQPKPMHEWSPYQHVNAPHLVDNMRSKRGEFRLVALPNGRTRLEGSTWYEIEMFPQLYWSQWSDLLVHRIHQRVLDHIKKETES
jgi:uncharacterized membrane protein YhaH (DUF805 family)